MESMQTRSENSLRESDLWDIAYELMGLVGRLSGTLWTSSVFHP